MIFANVRELKNKTSELLRATREGEDIIVTLRGKPAAVIRSLTEEEIEDYVLNHPKTRRKLQQAYREYKRLGGKDLDRFIEELGS